MAQSHRRRRNGRTATSHDVAREANVSQATVSRAFTSPESVSVEARERVYQAASRLDYSPNAMARSLSSRSSGIVGLVVPNNSDYYEHVITLFTRALAGRDLQVLLFEYEIGSEIDHVLQAVRSYQVDALIISAMILAPAQAALLTESGIPVAMFNYHSDREGVGTVSVDAAAGMQDLADLLIANGHDDIVYVGGLRDSTADQIRYRAAAERLAGHRIALPYVAGGAFTYEAGLQGAAAVLDLDPVPRAVMAACDSIAFGIIDGLRRAGRDVPGDVSVTGFDGIPQSAWLSYDLTTVEQPLEQLIAEALELVLADGAVLDHRLIPGRLEVRGTVLDRTTGEVNG